MMPQNEMNNNINEDEIDIRLATGQIISIGDCPSRFTPEPPEKYSGKFLEKDGNNVLTLGICAEKRRKIEYKVGDYIAVSYMALRSLYSFNAKIIRIREAVDEDQFDTGDMLNELKSIYGYDNYIFDVIPESSPEKQQRREFFRMPLSINVYYKPISEQMLEDIKSIDLKFEIEFAREKKKEADEGILEAEEGFAKLSTMDVSAGGFKCKHHVKINVDTYLNCMLIVGNEALPVIARIVGSKPDDIDPYLCDLRASFYRISDPVRDRLVKYIFYQQRQLQAKFLKRRF